MENISVPVKPEPPFGSFKRSCNGCTACCSGTLMADIHGIHMGPNSPCHFNSGSGCVIYEKRPELCKNYRCLWLMNNSIPEWLWPKISNVIITPRSLGEINYFTAHETPDKMSTMTLNWLVQWAIRSNVNLAYTVNGAQYVIGSEDFKKAFASRGKPQPTQEEQTQ